MREVDVPIDHPDCFYIGGRWESASTSSTVDVVDATTELTYYTVAEAVGADVDSAIAAARRAFDDGPWPLMSHSQRADYLREFGAMLAECGGVMAQMWPRESGVLARLADPITKRVAATFDYYAGLAEVFPFTERLQPSGGGQFGLLVREPVGVVGAVVPWNAALSLAVYKLAPALLAGCTVVLKAAPDAPGAAYVLAQVAHAIGLPPGVLNVLTAGPEASEQLVRDPRIDKVAFTGSTTVGRHIASICGSRVARCSLELGGKSAAIVLDDVDLDLAAKRIAHAESFLSGQVCSSLTRCIVTHDRHDTFVERLADRFSQIVVGDPFDARTQMGPLASERQLVRVQKLIATGVEEGATLVTGGGRPRHLDRGYYFEPTVFANVDNSSTIAQEEIFGPVLAVIPAVDEEDAIRIANDTVYGLNASVFTDDVDRAQSVASRLRTGTVGHNNARSDFAIAVGGFKQSGIGREGGKEGLLPYLEVKTIILEAVPTGQAMAE